MPLHSHWDAASIALGAVDAIRRHMVQFFVLGEDPNVKVYFTLKLPTPQRDSGHMLFRADPEYGVDGAPWLDFAEVEYTEASRRSAANSDTSGGRLAARRAAYSPAQGLGRRVDCFYPRNDLRGWRNDGGTADRRRFAQVHGFFVADSRAFAVVQEVELAHRFEDAQPPDRGPTSKVPLGAAPAVLCSRPQEVSRQL